MMKTNQRGFSLISLLIFFTALLSVGLLTSSYLRNEPESKEDPQKLLQKQFNLKFAYSKKGAARIYDFSTNKEVVADPSINRVTRYLWSIDGEKLAILVQGEYDPQFSFAPLRKAYATTAGFNYLLYLVDVETGATDLMLDRVFGVVHWSVNSDGLYFTEGYNRFVPYYLGSEPTPEGITYKYFFISLDKVRSDTTLEDFNQNAYVVKFWPPVLTSPDGELTITLSGDIGDRQMIFLDKEGNLVLELEGQNPTWAPIN